MINFSNLLKALGSLGILLVLCSCNPQLKEGEPIVVNVILPNVGALDGGTKITISGNGLGFIEKVLLGEGECTELTVVNDSTLTCLTPAGSSIVAMHLVGKANKSLSVADAFTYQESPSISSFTPANGKASGGETLTILGSGFLPGLKVLVGENYCLNVNVVDSTEISCMTKYSSAGAKKITVTNVDGQFDSSISFFTVYSGPSIISISPSGGSLAGGTTLTVNGIGFLSNTAITVGSLPCTNSFTYIGPNKLTCKTPGPSSGFANVKVQNFDGQNFTLSNGFQYRPAPTITGLSVTGGSIYGGKPLTISGTGFVTGSTADVNGVACTNNGYVSSTSYLCITPPGVAGSAVGVTITNPDPQSVTLPASYTYRPAPTVTSISPTSGPTSGGTLITINGTGFVSEPLPTVTIVPTVTIGASSCGGAGGVGPATFVSSTKITCTTTSGSAGLVQATVTNSDNQSGLLGSAFNYFAPPVMTSINPAEGVTTGGTSVTITGTGFRDGATVTFGSSPCTGVTVASATSLTCTTPSGGAGAPTIMVKNTDLQAGSSGSLFVYKTPATIQWNEAPSYSYGSLSTNSTNTFTLKNNGGMTSSEISISLGGADSANWTLETLDTDTCTGSTLPGGATCTVKATFMGGLLSTVSGSYSASLIGTATTGGTATEIMTATKP